MSGSAFAVTHHAFSSGAGRTSDGNGSHASTLKSPSYTKSVSWQHYLQHRKMALLELIQKHIRQRDLLGLVDQIVSLLVTGNTNDRQLKALFNYVLQTGDAQRFRAFIGEIAERAPQEKEKLMTIADRLREEGAMQGKHEEALRIAQEMLDRGLDRELVMMVTRLSPDDLIAQSH